MSDQQASSDGSLLSPPPLYSALQIAHPCGPPEKGIVPGTRLPRRLSLSKSGDRLPPCPAKLPRKNRTGFDLYLIKEKDMSISF
ncbi:unnamed protein product [Urochloa humidicola]